MPEAVAQVVVVGAGPGGLAAAAELGRAGLRALVLERAGAVGASWRGHYDRLHLHTVRWLSGLPGLPIPRREGPWVSRDGFVAYLEAYALHHRLEVRTGVEVRGLRREGRAWRVATSGGELPAAAVVVATGQNRLPLLPPWPGLATFRGQLLHSSRYRSGAALGGRDVLVVGAGNSGAEIAVDLVEQGAARVRLSVRRPPNVVQRQVAGVIPAQLVAIALRRLPLAVSDALARATAQLTVGDLTRFGLPAPERGAYTQLVRDRQVPILDVGLVAALRARRIEVVPAVEGFEGTAVLLRGGARIEPEVVVAATGFRHGLEELVGGLGLLDERSLPRVHGAATAPQAPGLHLIGFTTPPAGNLREMALDARRIARAVRAGLADPPPPSAAGARSPGC
jgi:putative flavoprotein involved in K+ transport